MKWVTKKSQVWYLHKRTVIFKFSGERVNYFFSKNKEGELSQLPAGYKVEEAENGMPYLKRI